MLPTRDVDELIALAYRDDLTGLYNRRYFRESLTRPLEEAFEPAVYSFLLVDIDFFKDINDSYGHPAGDHVLVTVAKILTEALEGEETAIRYAGDEFIVFLPGSDRRRWSTARDTPRGRGGSCGRSRSASRTSPAARWATGATQSACTSTSTRSSTRRRRGRTSSGSETGGAGTWW